MLYIIADDMENPKPYHHTYFRDKKILGEFIVPRLKRHYVFFELKE